MIGNKQTTKSDKQVKNQPVGVGRRTYKNHQVLEEKLDASGNLLSRIARRPSSGNPYSKQTKINAFNFPFTFNPAAGCFYRCIYCYLRQNFFQRHVTTDHGKEINFAPDLVESTRKFLARNADLPQFMKRIQFGVSTEIFQPRMAKYLQMEWVFREFIRAAQRGNVWMIHLLTKSPDILRHAAMFRDMREFLQIEVSFVTFDEEASRIFEQGTPSVSQRLNIVETLAEQDNFVRVMLMPVLREYELQTVKNTRHIVFENRETGERRPGKKTADSSLGNVSHAAVDFRIHDGRRWVKTPIDAWEPVLVKDWSLSDQAERQWRDRGAKAFKQKDLNYFYVDELIRAHNENRNPESERGRMEDPDAEILIHSGESVSGPDGAPLVVRVPGLHLPNKKWTGDRPPMVERTVMDYGYNLHSPINWIDCR